MSNQIKKKSMSSHRGGEAEEDNRTPMQSNGPTQEGTSLPLEEIPSSALAEQGRKTNQNYVRGSDTSIQGFPLLLKGKVVKGFGRGSKELGIPTANLPIDDYKALLADFPVGVYHGWGCVPALDGSVPHKVAMSIGWNPFYKNKEKTIEAHIIHDYGKDFYGEEMRIIVLGYIRPELDYISKEALIEDIKKDIEYSQQVLDTPPNSSYQTHTFFTSSS
ncbi:Riboflavin kinase [Balamuthia mandrillaris]